MSDVRLCVQCEKDSTHIRVVPMANFFRNADESWLPMASRQADAELKKYFARRVGEIVCGQSPLYIYRPGELSPLGRCVICWGALRYEIEELEAEGDDLAESDRPGGGAGGPD